MNTLKLNDREIHSLAELRADVDITQLMAAFLNESLEKWLSDCYYEREADAVARLDHSLLPVVEQQLCTILGIKRSQNAMTAEQRAVYDRKCAAILRCSSDQALLSHVMETATNQSELAELLNNGCKTIYLCEGTFSVPIRKSGIHYCGIGNPKVETTFTEEQYKKAGITFDGITLPEMPDAETAYLAEQAAHENGYDDFAEKHCCLATLLHDRIKGYRIYRSYCLKTDADDVATEFYKSKQAAEQAAEKVIESAYSEANSYFQPDRVGCIAPWTAEQYAAIFRDGTKSIAARLRSLTGEKAELANQLYKLADQAERELLHRFEQELTESSDFYLMYKKSYFLKQVEIEKDDYNLDLFESDILNGLARLLHDDSEYTVENLIDIVSELEDDVNKHADTFFGCAYQEYKNYCREAEKIAEEIGKDLSDDDLVKLGVLK